MSKRITSKREKLINEEEKKPYTTAIMPITPVEEFKDKPYPKTSACLIIGDEILNGKTIDTNSGTFARYCFDHGIDLKRIEVVPDEEDIIIEAVRRLSANFDFVITSGGIGPTHDDITYPSIAKAYNLELKHHQLTFDRMSEYALKTPSVRNFKKFESNQKMVEARKRMSTFPDPSNIVYPNETNWVPLVIVNENIHILPGIPHIFKDLLFGFSKYLKIRKQDDGENFFRKFVKTFNPENTIAPVLTEIHERVQSEGIKVGSYPKWTDDKKWVIVSFLSRKKNKDKVEELCKEVADRIDGWIIDDIDGVDGIDNNDNGLIRKNKL